MSQLNRSVEGCPPSMEAPFEPLPKPFLQQKRLILSIGKSVLEACTRSNRSMLSNASAREQVEYDRDAKPPSRHALPKRLPI
jgi:hypothetical protein